MATTDSTGNDKINVQIAGLGHVYFGTHSVTEAPDLSSYAFGNGGTLSEAGWTWLGDVSSENIIEFETDGGDTTTKRTWDRTGVRATREDVTHSMTINAVGIGKDVFEVAFPGSTYDEDNKMWRLNLSGASEKAILIVVEEGTTASGWYFPKVSLAGSMPALSTEEFTEIPITGTILGSDVDGLTVGYLEGVERAAA